MIDEKAKIICDLVHGYVKITKDKEKVINHESFQRLKHISQMTANYLYPSANHTRFEHSLGVMKLSQDFFYKLKHQFRLLLVSEGKDEETVKKIIQFLRLHLEYAALLHDVGHSPLSHLGEKFFDKTEILESIKNELTSQGIEIINLDLLKKGSKHEWMSCYIIVKKFFSLLLEIFISESVKIDIEFIIRIITGNNYEDQKIFDYPERDITISIVNSKTIDVDKLDYLIRDNYMTGSVGPTIDVVRLLESLTITKSRKLSFSKVGLSTLQKIIECRDSIYLWVCNHHTVVYTDYLIGECIQHMINLNDTKKPPKYLNINRLKTNQDAILKYYYKKEYGYRLQDLTPEREKELLILLFESKYLPFEEAIRKSDYFSVHAIAEEQITDHEIYALIRRAKNYAKDELSSTYTHTIVDQLLNRNFLKPVWKTLFEYKRFVEEHFPADIREDIIAYITNDENNGKNRVRIVSLIWEHAKCKPGEVFLIVRQNKFYFKADISQFFIYMNNESGEERNESLYNLLPHKDYKSIFSEIAFYLYCKEEKKQEVVKAFIKIMRDYRKIDKKYEEIMKV